MTELPVHYDIYGRRYNFAHESICVRADMGGAEIFEMKKEFVDDFGKSTTHILILAHSERDAEETWHDLIL